MPFARGIFEKEDLTRTVSTNFPVACGELELPRKTAEELALGCGMPVTEPARRELEIDEMAGRRVIGKTYGRSGGCEVDRLKSDLAVLEVRLAVLIGVEYSVFHEGSPRQI
jgi:hypothetical protein